ncbi:type II secretion system F family protein [Methylotenera sp. G11]|uniref:type II secretion system F family protein n=1 Tax=Methylotenera sp. G11 TaxID=1506585 RepID=UPI00064788DC|nr:type II secretion system F family protein [Methylotenera sp. G11]
MIFIIILLLIGLVAIGLMFLRQYKVHQQLITRLQFGFDQQPEAIDIVDLSAGDYGLQGSERIYYHLREFLNTPQGKILMFSLGAIVASAALAIMEKPFRSILLGAGGGGILLLTSGLFFLYVNKKEKLNKIQTELPNALELLAAIMEGGMAFESALVHMLREADPKHPLYFDLLIVSEAIKKGRRRNEALALWANRCELVYISDVVSSMIQAEQTGASLGSVLKHHAQAVLRENEAVIQRRAERLPVRMLMPMAGCILPAVIIVAAGPSIVRIMHIIDDIISK